MRAAARSEERAVLVTGACGYLGSQVIRDLAEQLPEGRKVRLLDNLSSGRLEALQNLPPGRFEFVEGDLLDPTAVRQALSGVGTVIHLAAIARTPFGFQDADRLVQVNHWGTAQLIEACLAAGVERFLLASSTAVYGPIEGATEGSPRRPWGPYGRSKLGAEKVVEAAAQRGLATTVFRIGSLFGLAPVTRFEAVANRFAYLAGVGRALPVFGSGEQRRSVVHVLDASRIICRAVVEGLDGAWNLAAMNASVNEIVEALKAEVGDLRVRHTETDHLTHLSLGVDTTQLEGLGWGRWVDLREGLGQLVRSFAGVGVPPTRKMPTDLQTLELDD